LKKNIIFYFLTLFVVFSVASCNGDSNNDEIQEKSTGNYWPTTVDNRWKYSQSGEDILIMMIVDVNEIDGAKYYRFNQWIGTGVSMDVQGTPWIKKDKGNYFIKIGDVNDEHENFRASGFTFLFFKDYLNINETWEGTYSQTVNRADLPSVTTISNYTGKILEKGISLTVNGKVYNDVIKFNFTQSVSVSPWPADVFSTNYWIAKNVGIIKLTRGEVVEELKSFVVK